MPDQVNMSSSYSARTATEGDAVAMMRIATDAFNGAGNTVDSHICPERLRTATGKEDMFSYRVSSLRSTLNLTRFPDRLATVAVCTKDGAGEEIAG